MNGQDLHSINQQDSVFGRPLTSDPSSLVHDPTALHPLALSHHHISIGAGAGIGYPDYLSESLKSTNDALHDVRLPSNNSSRTFCERSASQSPRTTGQEGEEAAQLLRDGSLQEPATGTMLLQEEMSVAYDEAGNVLHHHMPAIGHGQSMGNGSGPYGFPHEPTADLDQAYQASPFAFQYDPSAEEYGRAAPMYAGGHSYDMAYMQHMAHMSAHIEDQTAQNASTMSHHIPLGKRRPRTIMISGEDSSEKMYASTELLQHHQGPSAYEDRSMVAHHHEASCYHEPHNDMPHDPQHEMHHEMHHDPKAYPMAMHPSRYYYPNDYPAGPYSGLAMSQDMAAGSKPDPMEDPKSAMMHDPRYLPHYYSHVSDDVLGVGVHHPMDGAQMLEAPLQHGNPVVVEKTSKSSKGLSKKSTSKAAAKAALVAGESVETADGKDANKRQKHVKKACVHCKKAHLACDEERPCRRCVHLGKTDCVDVEHKRRGRPRSSPEKRPSLCVTEGTLAVIDAAAAAATAASLSTKKGRQQHATVAVKMEARQVPFDPQSYVICPTDTFSGELMGQGGVPLLAPPAE